MTQQLRRGTMMLVLSGSTILAIAPQARAQATPGSGYHVTRHIDVGGEGGWDYLTYDAPHHHLFLSHGTQVDIVDPDAGAVV